MTLPERRKPRTNLQRLPADKVEAITAAYQAGATTREVGASFGLPHTSVNKLLKQHGVTARRRSPGEAERAQGVVLYAMGKQLGKSAMSWASGQAPSREFCGARESSCGRDSTPSRCRWPTEP